MIVRKKPVEVEAYKLTQDNAAMLSDWCKGLLVKRADNFEASIQIVTLEGIMTARCGDYIIKGVAGEFYPVAPAIFDATYDVIDP